MSFQFVENEAFEWPVEIHRPVEGAHVSYRITGLFEIMDDAEFLAPHENVTTNSEAIAADIDKLVRIFKGWKPGDVTDARGNPMEPDESAIRRFLGQRPNRLAVQQAYSEAISPVRGYRAKN